MARMIDLFPVAEMSNRLAPQFSLIQKSGPIPPEVQDAAKRWLVASTQQDNPPAITVLQRARNEWWLFHIRRLGNQGTHHQASAMLGQLREAPMARTVPSLLANFAWGCEQQPGSCCSKVEEPKSMAPARECGLDEARALLAVALGFNGWVSHPQELVTVLRLIAGAEATAVDESAAGDLLLEDPLGTSEVAPLDAGLENTEGTDLPPCLQWVASINGIPPVCPAGPGLVLGPEPIVQLPRVQRCFDQAPATIERMHLAQLAHVKADSPVKTHLMLQALGQTNEPLQEGLPGDALAWLARFPTTRDVVVEGIAEEGVAAWLQAISSFPGTELLEKLADRHGRKIRDVVARELARWSAEDRSHPDYFDLYYRLFNDDPVVRTDLLVSPYRDVWESLCGTGSEFPAVHEEIEALLQKLGPRGRTAAFSLEGLAWAAKPPDRNQRGVQPPGKNIKALFYLQLKKHWPTPLQALYEGKQLPPGTALSIPPLSPSWDWLRGVEARPFLRRCSPYGRWWYDCVVQLYRNGALQRDDLLEEGLTRRENNLLNLAEAGPTLLALVNGEKFTVPVPNEEWHAQADPLLQELFDAQQLWARLEPPLTREGMAWLCNHMTQKEARMHLKELFEQLVPGRPVDPNQLRSLAPLLEGEVTLRQVVRVSADTTSPNRTALLRALLHDKLPEPAKRNWLHAYLLTCDALPAYPDWTAAELLILLTILDPIDHVVRVILERKNTDPKNEDALLNSLIHRLDKAKPYLPVVPRPTNEQRTRRPTWYRDLGLKLGWEEEEAPQPKRGEGMHKIPKQRY